jgi:hypothetical protein
VERGSGARELTKALEERDVEVKVVLLRARDRELRLCGELSMVTRRWQPADARGSRGARAGGQQGRGTGPGEEEADAWRKRKQEVDGDGLHSGGRRGSTAGGRAEQSSVGESTCSGRKKRRKGSGGLV